MRRPRRLPPMPEPRFPDLPSYPEMDDLSDADARDFCQTILDNIRTVQDRLDELPPYLRRLIHELGGHVLLAMNDLKNSGSPLTPLSIERVARERAREADRKLYSLTAEDRRHLAEASRRR